MIDYLLYTVHNLAHSWTLQVCFENRSSLWFLEGLERLLEELTSSVLAAQGMQRLEAMSEGCEAGGTRVLQGQWWVWCAVFGQRLWFSRGTAQTLHPPSHPAPSHHAFGVLSENPSDTGPSCSILPAGSPWLPWGNGSPCVPAQCCRDPVWTPPCVRCVTWVS